MFDATVGAGFVDGLEGDGLDDGGVVDAVVVVRVGTVTEVREGEFEATLELVVLVIPPGTKKGFWVYGQTTFDPDDIPRTSTKRGGLVKGVRTYPGRFGTDFATGRLDELN